MIGRHVFTPRHRAPQSRTFFVAWLDAVTEAKARSAAFGIRYRVERIGRKWAVMPTRPA